MEAVWDKETTAIASGLRPNTAVVNLATVTRNVQLVRQLVGSGVRLFGAVKADGYGLGLPMVAQAMLRGGVDGFSSADPLDAVRIREAGIELPILLYAGVLPSREAVGVINSLRLICTVTDLDNARAFSAVSHEQLPVMAKVDVGLERLGTYAEVALPFISAVADDPRLRLEGIYTHLHGSEDASYLQWQLGRFRRLVDVIRDSHIKVPLVMAESSASLDGEVGPTCNAADPGHLLYGLLPAGRSHPPVDVRPALESVSTRVLQIRAIQRTEYRDRAPFTVREGMRVAVIPIGRSDGLRSLTTGMVRVCGQLAPIVGRLSLEHARVDVTDVVGCKVGDRVDVLSAVPGSGISLAEVAAHNSLDPVGVLMEVRSSIVRRYVDDPQGS